MSSPISKQTAKRLVDALEALEVKELCAGGLFDGYGSCCAVGAMVLHERVVVYDVYDFDAVSALQLPPGEYRSIFETNDDLSLLHESHAERYTRMLAWAKGCVR